MSLRKALNAAYGAGDYKTSDVHPAGAKLKLNEKLRSMFGYDLLCVTIETCNERTEDFEMINGHYDLEWKHLQDYCLRYGEFPAVNG
jgi:hypothetical protein